MSAKKRATALDEPLISAKTPVCEIIAFCYEEMGICGCGGNVDFLQVQRHVLGLEITSLTEPGSYTLEHRCAAAAIHAANLAADLGRQIYERDSQPEPKTSKRGPKTTELVAVN